MKRLTKIGLLVLMLLPMMFISACKSKIVSITVTGAKTEFLFDEEFSLGDTFDIEAFAKDKKAVEIDISNLELVDDTKLKNDVISIDFSAYKKDQVGRYTIIVTYLDNTKVTTDYTVNVVAKQFTDSDYRVDNYEGIYDGNSHTIVVTNYVGATIKYGLTAGSYTLDTPISYKNAGEHKIYFKIEKNGYEPPVEGYGIVKITKASLTITPNPVVIEYNTQFGNMGSTYSGFVNGENENTYTYKGSPTYTTNYLVGNDVGEYEIYVSGFEFENYEVSYGTGKLQVVQAENNLTVDIGDITYGSIFNPAIKNPANVPVITRYTVFEENDWHDGLPTAIGKYTVQFSTEATNNYKAASVTANVSINKKSLVIRPNNVTIKYGEVFVDNGATFDSFVLDENESNLIGSAVYTTNYETGNDVGTYTISISGYSSQNYEIEYVDGTLTVDKAENVLIVEIANVTYGTLLTPVVNQNIAGTTISYMYRVSGNETFINGLPTGAGIYDIMVSSLETKNYLQGREIISDVTINKKQLTITPKTVNIRYNENYIPGGFDYEGFVYNGTTFIDNESLFNGTNPVIEEITYTKGDDAGEYTVRYSGFTSGEQEFTLSNYEMVINEGKIIVSKADRTFDDVLIDNVTYGEKLTVKLVGEIQGSETEFGYEYKISGSEEWIPCEELPTVVGEYDIAVILRETKNYNAGRVEKLGVTIGKRTLTITPTAPAISYNDPKSSIEYSAEYVNFATGEDESVLSGELVYSTEYEQGSDVGEYKITASGLESDNYNIVYKTGRLVVNKAKNNLEIMFNSVTYGDEIVPVEISNPSGLKLRYEYQLEGTSTWVQSAVDVGTYNVRVSCPENKNYETVENLELSTKLVIGKRLLTITPKNATIVYNQDFKGNDPYKDVEFVGFVYGESVSRLSGELIIVTEYSTGKDVGEYEITIREDSYRSANYEIVYGKGTLTVVRAENDLEVAMVNKTYGTTLRPSDSFIYNPSAGELTYSYMLSSESEDIGEWKTGLPTDVGSYTIKVVSAETKNYNQCVRILHNIEIKKADLIITINDVTLHYGEEFDDSQVQLSYSGFVYNENEEVLGGQLIITTDYETGNIVGVYDIKVSGLESNNYNIICYEGRLEVLKAINTMKVSVKGVTYGDLIDVQITDQNSSQEVVIRYRNINGVEYTTEAPKTVGTYDVQVMQSATTNYEGFSYTYQNIQIVQRTVILEWGETEFTYDGNPHIPTVKITNLVYDDECELTMSSPETQANETGYTAVVYSVTNENYRLPDINNINFIIHKATIAEPAEFEPKTYTGKVIEPEVEGDSQGRYSVYYSVQEQGFIYAGEYTVTYTIIDNNYKWENAETNVIVRIFRILKAEDNEITDVNVESYDYNNEKEISAKSKYGNVIIEYKEKAEDALYSQSKPVDAGNYIVRFTVIETESFNGCSEEREFTINKINPTYTTPDMVVSVHGETLENIQLGHIGQGDLIWADPKYVLSDEDTDAVEVQKMAVFTPYDKVNYNVIEIPVTIHVVDNRPITIQDSEVVIEDLTTDFTGGVIQPEITLTGNATGAIITYRMEGEEDYYDGLPTFVNVGEYKFYIRLTKVDSVTYTYKDVEYKYQREYNTYDYPNVITLTIEDYISYLTWNYNYNLAHLSGTELVLDGYMIDAVYASGITEELDLSEFEIVDFKNTEAGEQAVTLKKNGRTYFEVMNVLVYDAMINEFTFTYLDENGYPYVMGSNKVSDKVYEVEFTSQNMLYYTSEADYLGFNGNDLYGARLSFDPATSILLEEGVNNYTVYINVDLGGYIDIYTLNIRTNIPEFTIIIDNSVATYNQENDEYTITRVVSDNYSAVQSPYGYVKSIYEVGTTEFIEENDLIVQHSNIITYVLFNDYPESIVEFSSNYITFRATIKVEMMTLPVNSIRVNGKDYEITDIHATVYATATMNEDVVVDFKSLDGYVATTFLDGQVWIDDENTMVTLHFNPSQGEQNYYFTVYLSRESYVQIQTIAIVLIQETHIESFTVTTKDKVYNLKQSGMISISESELITDISLTMEEGYSYKLYCNNELVNSVEELVLTIGMAGNNIAVVTLDSNSEIVAYAYYTISLQMYGGYLMYSDTNEFNSENSLIPDSIKCLPDNENTLYFKFESTYSSKLYINGSEKSFNTKITLNNGLNAISVCIKVNEKLTVKYEYVIYIGNETAIYESESAQHYNQYNIYDTTTDLAVIYDITYNGITYTVDSYNEVELNKFVVKDYAGNRIDDIQLTQSGRYILIKWTHNGEKLINIVTLYTTNNVTDDNTKVTFYYMDSSGKTTELSISDTNEVVAEAYNGDSFMVVFMNKKATMSVENMDSYANYINVRGEDGETIDIIVKITASDGIVTKEYTLRVTISQFEAFRLTHSRPENDEFVAKMYLEQFLYSGDIKLTSETYAYSTGIITEMLSDYNIYNEDGEEYDSGKRYVKVSMSSKLEDFGAYRAFDAKGAESLETDTIEYLSEKIENYDEVLLEIMNDGTYDYYTFYIYIRGSVVEIKVYLLSEEQAEDMVIVTMVIECPVDEEITDAELNIHMFNGYVMGDVFLSGLSIKEDGKNTPTGKFENSDTIYYVLYGYMVYADADYHTLVAYISMDYETREYTVYDSESPEIEIGTKFTFNRVSDTIHTVVVVNSTLAQYFNSLPENVKVRIDNVQEEITIETVTYDMTTGESTTNEVEGDEFETNLTKFDDYTIGIVLKITIGTESYIVFIQSFEM